MVQCQALVLPVKSKGVEIRRGAKFRDTWQLVRRLKLSRCINLGRLYFSYQASRLLKKPFHAGLPAAVAVEPTTSCNLRCPECPSGLRSFSRPTGRLSLVDFKNLVDEISPFTLYLTLYFQGEPYLNKELLDMVAYAHARGLYTATSTNAHFLTDDVARRTVESGLCRLIISVDGATQDVYAQYRVGGRLQKVLDGARRVADWKRQLKSSTPHVIFQFLVVRPNEHQMEDVARLAKECGADEVRFKTAQIYDYENGHPLIPLNEKFARYRLRADGRWEIKNALGNRCWRMWHSCVVTWDGRVVPCCFDKDATYVLGQLNGRPLKDVWRGSDYREFRRKILRARREIDICTNCTEGTRVWGH